MKVEIYLFEYMHRETYLLNAEGFVEYLESVMGLYIPEIDYWCLDNADFVPGWHTPCEANAHWRLTKIGEL